MVLTLIEKEPEAHELIAGPVMCFWKDAAVTSSTHGDATSCCESLPKVQVSNAKRP